MRAWTDERVERMIGALLRWGVILAAAVVLAGGAMYLVRYGSTSIRLPGFSRGTVGPAKCVGNRSGCRFLGTVAG